MFADQPPEPATDAERLVTQAIAMAVLDWAGLDADEADAPGYETIPVPSMLSAEGIAKCALAEIKRQGLVVVRP